MDGEVRTHDIEQFSLFVVNHQFVLQQRGIIAFELFEEVVERGATVREFNLARDALALYEQLLSAGVVRRLVDGLVYEKVGEAGKAVINVLEAKGDLVNSLDEEQVRATREGLGEDELALFDLLKKDGLDKTSRERVKQASKDLLAKVKARLSQLDRFWEKEQTKAEVEVFILDEIISSLPTPPFTSDEKNIVAQNVYAYVWQQAVSGEFARAA